MKNRIRVARAEVRMTQQQLAEAVGVSRQTVNAIVDKFSDEEGWVALDRVGDELAKRLPDFDVRNYGFKKLRPFIKSLGVYDLDEPAQGSDQRQIYLRLRDQEG